jgi:hypothetical protein
MGIETRKGAAGIYFEDVGEKVRLSFVDSDGSELKIADLSTSDVERVSLALLSHAFKKELARLVPADCLDQRGLDQIVSTFFLAAKVGAARAATVVFGETGRA